MPRHRLRQHSRVILAWVLSTSLLSASVCGEETTAVAKVAGEAVVPVDFARDVQPIFAKHCYSCHAGKNQEGGIQWDRRASALKGGDSGEPPIVPGDPAKSPLLALVRRTGDEVMPPDGEGEPVPADQIAVLERWIAAGAPWPDDAAGNVARPKHWSFIPPRRPSLPAVRQENWCRDDLDRFVLARLEREGLTPTPEADSYTLIRRVYLDLVGSVPAPEEVDAFIADARPDAYERLVDRLLSSPHYGERWARVWLDLARYADTQGYEKDNRRTIWRYRDWVIDALNRDLPYDQFTIEQLAGDLLPSPTTDQIVATAFHRNTMTNTEGGTDDEEFRTAAVVDRTNTTAQVWMGLTLGCAQCHSHKYDPITQRDYYRFYAFLNQTEDYDQADERPTMPAPTPDLAEKIAAMDAAIVAAQLKLTADIPELVAGQAAWEKRWAARQTMPQLKLGAWHALPPYQGENQAAVHDKVFEPETKQDLKARYAKGKRLWQPRPDLVDGRTHALTDQNSAFYLLRTVTSTEATLIQLSLGSDDGIKLWVNGDLLLDHNISRGVEPDQEKISAHLKAGENQILMKITNGGGPGGFYFRMNDEQMPPALWQIVRIPKDKRTTKQQRQLTAYYRQIAPELHAVQREVVALRQKKQTFITKNVPTVPVMRDLPADKRRKTHVLLRGNFLTKGPEVEPGTPEAFPPLPAAAPRNRLGMARWLVSRENPLTARVAVNRYWEKLFGEGIVLTSEDFGTQGAPPTNPELLDYLAVEFMEQGWSAKKLLKRLVLSATYRQSSRVTSQLVERDRDNRLLARGPRFRLDAETVRDQALSASGLLSEKRYGPSVMPPQPEGVWQVVYNTEKWITSTGEDRYRRGIYTFWRRTSPYPSMMAFDATSREVCTVRRTRTNTPLAALVTLNDPVYVEAAQAIARLAVARGGATVEQRARYAFRRVLVRPPRDEEVARLVALYQTEFRHFEANAAAAAKLAGAVKPRSRGASAAELAAWTVVANVLLNLDESLTKM